MNKVHDFHIPVMGIGYTADTPVKVAQYGIDSVVSLVDDILLEKLRKVYCEKYEVPYKEITDKIEDFRAERISSYLNLINKIAKEKFEELKEASSKKSREIEDYFNMLPDSSLIKSSFVKLKEKCPSFTEMKSWFKDNLTMGSIDVNIMVKMDKENYQNGEQLPQEFNDAHSALRGFANSDLHSSIVLSAGLNPRLVGYMEQFEDFYPDANNEIKKKITIKVSDYKSAFVQGRFLAKKGLWVSEYRIESGLNCGGHAFASDGYLMGPVLEEFREKREELQQSVFEVLSKALQAKGKNIPEEALPMKVTAQGGVGTAEEHQFLIDHYKLDSVGWGTPFMLVPEAVTIDEETLAKLEKAKEKDLYLSNISPLGVLFNSLRGNTKDEEKQKLIEAGTPGSICQKKYASINREFTKKTICTASRQYQAFKIKELNGKNLPEEQYNEEFEKIVEKSCICVGLGTSALKTYKQDTSEEGDGVSVCPGPNMAYFDKRMSLKEMIDHIYGRANHMFRSDRPNMFIKELGLYVDHLKQKIEETKGLASKKQVSQLKSFADNLDDGIKYYDELFGSVKESFASIKSKVSKQLDDFKGTVQVLTSQLQEIKVEK